VLPSEAIRDDSAQRACSITDALGIVGGRYADGYVASPVTGVR